MYKDPARKRERHKVYMRECRQRERAAREAARAAQADSAARVPNRPQEPRKGQGPSPTPAQEPARAWSKILEFVADRRDLVTQDAVAMFQAVTPLSLNGKTLVLTAPAFLFEVVNRFFLPSLRAAIKDAGCKCALECEPESDQAQSE